MQDYLLKQAVGLGFIKLIWRLNGQQEGICMEHTFYDDKKPVEILGLLDFGHPELRPAKMRLLAEGYNQFLFTIIDGISSNVTGPDYEQVIELLNTAIRSAYFYYKAEDTKEVEETKEVENKTEQNEEEYEDFQWPDSNEGTEWEVSPFYAMNIDNSIERQKEKLARHKARVKRLHPIDDDYLIFDIDALFEERFLYLYFHPLYKRLKGLYKSGKVPPLATKLEAELKDKLIYLDVVELIKKGHSEDAALNRICHDNQGKHGTEYDDFTSEMIAKKYSTAKLGYEALISRWSRIFDGIP